MSFKNKSDGEVERMYDGGSDTAGRELERRGYDLEEYDQENDPWYEEEEEEDDDSGSSGCLFWVFLGIVGFIYLFFHYNPNFFDDFWKSEDDLAFEELESFTRKMLNTDYGNEWNTNTGAKDISFSAGTGEEDERKFRLILISNLVPDSKSEETVSVYYDDFHNLYFKGKVWKAPKEKKEWIGKEIVFNRVDKLTATIKIGEEVITLTSTPKSP